MNDESCGECGHTGLLSTIHFSSPGPLFSLLLAILSMTVWLLLNSELFTFNKGKQALSREKEKILSVVIKEKNEVMVSAVYQMVQNCG